MRTLIKMVQFVVVLVFVMAATVVMGQDWPNTIVDSSGNAGTSTSIAYDSNGLPKIAYVSDGNLRYAEYNSTELWQPTLVGYANSNVKLLIDDYDIEHICAVRSDDIYYYYKNGQGSWVFEYVASSGCTAQDFTLVYDDLYQVYVPHVAYQRSGQLRYAYRNPENNSWVTQTIDQAGYVGEYPSIAVDDQGRVYISYFDDTEDDLKFAFYNGQDWGSFVVDGLTSAVGQHTSLVLDNDGTPHIVYYDMDHDDLRHATISLSALGN